MVTQILHSGDRASLSDRVADVLRSLSVRWARHRLYRNTMRELGALSAAELADLGLHRSMLKRLAWQAAHES